MAGRIVIEMLSNYTLHLLMALEENGNACVNQVKYTNPSLHSYTIFGNFAIGNIIIATCLNLHRKRQKYFILL